MAKTTKKLLSLLLAMIMVLSLIPAVAAEGETETEPETQAPWTLTTSKAYTADTWIEVGSAADWDAAFKVDVGVNSTEYDEVGTIGVKLTTDVTLSPNETNSALWRIGSSSTRNVILDLGGYTLAVKSTGATCRMIRLFEVANGSDLTVINGKVEIGSGLLSNGGFARTTSADSLLTLDGVDVLFTVTAVGTSAKYGMFAYLAPGSATLINSRIEHTGTATMTGHGGLINMTSGDLIINNSHIIGGKSADRGGNIYNSAAMNLTISGENTLIADGTAKNRGGNIYDAATASKILMTGGEISNGTVTASGGVGANIAISGVMVMTDGYISTGNYGGYGRGISIFNTSATPVTKLYIYGGRINGVLGANNTYVDPLVRLYGGEFTTDPTNYQTGNNGTGATWVVDDCCQIVKEGNLWKVVHVDNETTETVEATCTTDGSKTTTCELCTIEHMGATYGGTYEYVLPAAHTEEVITGKAPTCDEPGLTDGVVCSVCGETVAAQEEIPALGHSEAEAVIENETAATCTEGGSYDSVIYCTDCGKEISRETITSEATGHTEADPVIENSTGASCTEPATYDSVVYCSVCGVELSRETITGAATGHSYEAVVTAPTCTEAGYTTYTCSVCGDTYTADEVDALGHTEQTVAGKAPTCTETGLTDGVVCSVCGETVTAQEEIPALGHTEQTVEGKAPTCTETGLTDGVVCSVCGETVTAQEEIPALGHDWDDGVYTEPTLEADGYTTYTCGVCGETKVETDEGSQKVALEISTQPVATSAGMGDNATFTIAASGKGVTYQWQYSYKNGTNWMNTCLPGNDTNTLTVTAYPNRDGYRYRCVVTDVDGNRIFSTPAILSVTTPAGIAQPADVTATAGANISFTVGTEGDVVSYQWQYAYKNGTNWMNTSLSGNTSSTLNVTAFASRDGYQYRCRIVLANGYVYTTDVAELTIE